MHGNKVRSRERHYTKMSTECTWSYCRTRGHSRCGGVTAILLLISTV